MINKDITFDVKTAALCVGCFILGNVYGSYTSMKAARRNIMLIKGRIIK